MVFDTISTEFRGISHVFVNFAALLLLEVSEALYLWAASFTFYKLATKNLHLATIILRLVAKRRPEDFFNFEPCNINIAVAIKRGGRPTRLLPHAKMLLVPRKFFFLPLSLSLRGRLCSGSVQVSLLSRFILVEYSRILINPYIKYITCLVSLFG